MNTFEWLAGVFLIATFYMVLTILFIVSRIMDRLEKKQEQDAEYIRKIVLKARPNAKLISNSHGHLRIEDGSETLTLWCANWMEAWTQAGNIL